MSDIDGPVLRDITDDDWTAVRQLAATSYGAFWHPETFAAWRTLMPPRSSVAHRRTDGADCSARCTPNCTSALPTPVIRSRG